MANIEEIKRSILPVLKKYDVKKAALIIPVILASAATLISIFTAIYFGQEQVALLEGESIWPLPGFIFIELIVFSLIGLAATILDIKESSYRWGLLIWSISGGIISIAILGIFSVGLFILPSALIYLCISLLLDLLNGRIILPGVGLVLLAGLVNGALIILLSNAIR